MILSRSTLLHLRFPFSFFLMPVFFFALSISPNLDGTRLIWSWFIIHLLLYPASNGYNSYFDKDEKSIGGLKNPPPVTKDLYIVSLLMDFAAIALGLIFINYTFAIMLLVYGLISKAYSHPNWRLKKYPIGGWLTVVFFQGIYTFAMCYVAINGYSVENVFHEKILLAGSLTSTILFATYPLTQVYQHEEDAQHGDKTMSMLLGIRGTFLFAMTFFTISSIGFAYFFWRFYETSFALIFLLVLSPVVAYFFFWFFRVVRNPVYADHRSTMRLNFLSGLCLNGFFIWLFITISHIAQL